MTPTTVVTRVFFFAGGGRGPKIDPKSRQIAKIARFCRILGGMGLRWGGYPTPSPPHGVGKENPDPEAPKYPKNLLSA